MAERVLTDDELLRALLARQALLERVGLRPERALEKLAGLQTQHAPTGYVGLFSRLAGFARADLTDGLTSGRVVQAWAMRSTIHMLSPRDSRRGWPRSTGSPTGGCPERTHPTRTPPVRSWSCAT